MFHRLVEMTGLAKEMTEQPVGVCARRVALHQPPRPFFGLLRLVPRHQCLDPEELAENRIARSRSRPIVRLGRFPPRPLRHEERGHAGMRLGQFRVQRDRSLIGVKGLSVLSRLLESSAEMIMLAAKFGRKASERVSHGTASDGRRQYKYASPRSLCTDALNGASAAASSNGAIASSYLPARSRLAAASMTFCAETAGAARIAGSFLAAGPATAQQNLYLRPLPHGQGSLRPGFAVAAASDGGCRGSIGGDYSNDFVRREANGGAAHAPSPARSRRLS
jgi:hypothetical protein